MVPDPMTVIFFIMRRLKFKNSSIWVFLTLPSSKGIQNYFQQLGNPIFKHAFPDFVCHKISKSF
ncbi:MAG TPA: hypothetical protein DHU93_05805 [Algoriphagus sp.]|nr:hypothetical protein [Algoriphagus sp.]